MKPLSSPDGIDTPDLQPVANGEGDLLSLGGSNARLRGLAEAEALAEDCPQGMAVLNQMADAMGNFTMGQDNVRIDLMPLPEKDVRLISQVLGEGEVNIGLAGIKRIEIRESVMAGLWRVETFFGDGVKTADWIELGAIPDVVMDAANKQTTSDIAIGTPPEGAMNVMPLLAEVQDRVKNRQVDRPNHVISFTLLPMTEADMSFLKTTLGLGPVSVLSKGYGTCRIFSTGIKDVWSVQFLNVMGEVVQDTLEIGGVPVSVLAAQEDVTDSAERLRDIMEAYL